MASVGYGACAPGLVPRNPGRAAPNKQAIFYKHGSGKEVSERV
jgi:hypothetical protein